MGRSQVLILLVEGLLAQAEHSPSSSSCPLRQYTANKKMNFSKLHLFSIPREEEKEEEQEELPQKSCFLFGCSGLGLVAPSRQ